jgi:integrase
MTKQINVTLASNGKYWQAKYIDSQGKRRNRSLGPKSELSKRAALNMCARLSAELIMNPFKVDAERMPSLAEWYSVFIQQKAGMSPNTIKTYRLAYDRLIQFLSDKMRIDKVTPTHAMNWKASLSSDGLSTASVGTYVSHVKTMFKAAVDQDLLLKSPFAKLKVNKRRFDREWHYVDHQTMQVTLDACPNPGWRCFLALQRYGGLRLGEAKKLSWGMVDLEIRQIHLPGRNADGDAVTKTRQPRMVPISPVLHAELANTKADGQQSDDLVVKGVTGSSISNHHSRMRTILKRAGVDPWEDVFQTLRRCAAQDFRALLTDSWAVTQIMGHSEAVEQDYYLSGLRQEDIDKVTGAIVDPDLDKVVNEWHHLDETDRKMILELIARSKPG